MVHIEITSPAITERHITTKQQKQITLKIQQGYLFLHDDQKYPSPVNLTVDVPYPPGVYTIDPGENLYVDRYGQMAVKSALVLRAAQ